MSDASEYAALIDQFGAGWSSGNADELVAPFADDAVFVPDPFAKPLRGKSAILEYWKDLPLEQAEMSFRFGQIFVAGPWFATEFRCTFRRRRTGEPVDVRGALFCETEDGKMTEMRMYWHRTTGSGQGQDDTGSGR